MTKSEIKKGLPFIIAGAVLFILRYIPLYHYNTGIIDKWFSLDSASGLCGTFLENLADQCNWIKPLNIIVIVAAIALAGYGIFLIYQEKKK
jgi:hypothetical protein